MFRGRSSVQRPCNLKTGKAVDDGVEERGKLKERRQELLEVKMFFRPEYRTPSVNFVVSSCPRVQQQGIDYNNAFVFLVVHEQSWGEQKACGVSIWSSLLCRSDREPLL